MQVKNKILFIMLTMLSLIACSSSEDGVGVTPSFHETYLRFVSPSGTNVLDSLHVMGENDKIVEIGSDLIAVSGRRASDGEALEMTTELYYGSKQAADEFEKDEALVRVWWADFNTWNIEDRPNKYNEIYTVTMTSPKLFGNNESHTLAWYVKVVGRTHDAYKCEVDGQEVSLDNDPFYNKYTYEGRHKVNAIITIPCNVNK
jgi:hypothetical protein